MRPLRFALTLAFLVVAFLLLVFAGPWRSQSPTDFEERSSIGAYFNWRTPSSLFPPSAIISLTDDNSTFFLARPAAFGPLLPTKSLSGQLWVGSGFGDDHLGRGGSGAGAEGELGCSDVPGWNDGDFSSITGGNKKANNEVQGGKHEVQSNSDVKIKRSINSDTEEKDGQSHADPIESDGTDDHLHHPLPASDGLNNKGETAGKTKKPAHADIQSLQESAEIAGKVVLLSRGGCGFLEKVKWVQRRGGIALIVGDDIRGGPLVTMYARGDTLNITIPALFTSHTTAHLLSSLIPSTSDLDDLTPEEVARLGMVLNDKPDSAKAHQKELSSERPSFTTTKSATKSAVTAKPVYGAHGDEASLREPGDADNIHGTTRSWFWLLWKGRGSAHEDSRRPPSSGNIDWVLQQDFEDEEGSDGPNGKLATTSTTAKRMPTKAPAQGSSDGFVIGVQDWRDADLVAEQKERLEISSSTSSVASAQSSKSPGRGSLKGGSITPGSGEYNNKASTRPVEHGSSLVSAKGSNSIEKAKGSKRRSGTWLSRLFRKNEELPHEQDVSSNKAHATPEPNVRTEHMTKAPISQTQAAEELHDGLWVTLTPTSMSSSPFFDTLLVLVVSPLVTLTVVYALLLLRSRIRRRRWRAPKSVVERLPVRTYQTMPSSTVTSSTTSSVSTPINATTPLLPTSARAISARSRPRSRTASEVPVQPSSSLRSDSVAPPSLELLEEKRAAGLAEWRRRYGGKQRECVVCLEEYVSGVSRVMSLPCGHEFHAECM